MTANLPSPNVKDGNTNSYLRSLVRALTYEINRRLVKDSPIDRLFLRSPSGKIYEVKVDDAGALSTTLVKE